jgi:hypothetical protein
MSSIDEFLDLQGRDGHLDSVGAFSIDQGAQLRKLQSAFLSDDTKALLKLIQALVGWGSESIQIGHCPQELSLYGSSVNLEKILTALINEGQDLLNLRDGPHTDLVIGLSRLLACNPSRVFFSFWREGRMERIHHWLGEGATAKLRRPPDCWQDGLGIHIQFPDSQWRFPFKFDDQELASRVFYCPCFIYLQKRLLGIKALRRLEFVWSEGDLYRETFMQDENGDANWYLEYFVLAQPGNNTIWPRPLYNTKTNLSRTIGWADTLQSSSSKSLFRMFSWGSWKPELARINRSKPISWAGVVTEAFGSPLPTCRSAVLVRDFRKRKAIYVYVVKRGVLIHQLSLQDNHPIGNASVVVVDDSCATDLSQFSLQGESAVAEILDKTKHQLIEALQLCLQHADAVHTFSDGRGLDMAESAALGVGALGMGGLAVLGAIPFGLLPIGLGGGWLVARMAHAWRYGKTQGGENLKQVQGWIDSLNSAT